MKSDEAIKRLLDMRDDIGARYSYEIFSMGGKTDLGIEGNIEALEIGVAAIENEDGKYRPGDNDLLHQAAQWGLRRYGEWTKVHKHIWLTEDCCKEWDNFYCSICDAPSNQPYKYCPHCGAKMDLEAENEQSD